MSARVVFVTSSGEEASEKQLHKTPKSMGDKSGLAKDGSQSAGASAIQDMSHYGMKNQTVDGEEEKSKGDGAAQKDESTTIVAALSSLENTIKVSLSSPSARYYRHRALSSSDTSNLRMFVLRS